MFHQERSGMTYQLGGLKVLNDSPTPAVTADKPSSSLWFSKLNPQVLCRPGWQPQRPAAGPRGATSVRGRLASTGPVPTVSSPGRTQWRGCKALGMENATSSARSLLGPWQRYGPCYIRISIQLK